MTAPPPRSVDAEAETATGLSRPAGVSRRAMLRGGLVGGGLVARAAGASASWALTGSSSALRSRPLRSRPAPGIPPDDDLVREHGVLKRVGAPGAAR
ncbi:MAG TPA: hypothetical protein VFW50_22715 [Streptosporangiaceae bacterium]|nr:hypothetical protein [Streptosporangiaceae bacterium]